VRLTRVYVEADLRVGARVALPEACASHLVRVLRLRAGDSCVLFNGDGHDHAARLLSIGKRGAEAEVLSSSACDNESPLHVTLLQGIARGEKMDLILQKATELGVAAIVPVQAERSEVKLDAERLARRMAHWRSVVVAACEQSGRARIPHLAPVTGLDQAAGGCPQAGLRLTLDPAGSLALATLPVPSPLSVVVAIGPEGGWSPRDRMILQGHRFDGMRLGPRVLRTETAGLAAIAALQARFGDLG
jgi:16S rRNA (uracil1498-N3)-methyltransferase